MFYTLKVLKTLLFMTFLEVWKTLRIWTSVLSYIFTNDEMIVSKVRPKNLRLFWLLSLKGRRFFHPHPFVKPKIFFEVSVGFWKKGREMPRAGVRLSTLVTMFNLLKLGFFLLSTFEVEEIATHKKYRSSSHFWLTVFFNPCLIFLTVTPKVEQI